MENINRTTATGNGSADLQDQARAQMERGRELVMNLADRLEAMIRQRPGTSLLVALGAGFIIGRIVRR